MKNFVIALVFTLIASFGLQAQNKTDGNFCYIGCTVEQIQKDFPQVHKLKADNPYVKSTLNEDNFNETWTAYGVNLGDGQSVIYFNISLASGLCDEYELQTFKPAVRTAFLLPFAPFMVNELDIMEEQYGTFVENLPNNPNTNIFIDHRRLTSLFTSTEYRVHIFCMSEVQAVK